MQEEMEKLTKATKERSASSKDNFQTPPPRIPAPSPVKDPVKEKKAVKPTPKKPVVPPKQDGIPETEGARLQRLRRLCERKPSGRINVPEAIHLRWLNGGKHEREALIDELEKSGWDKDRT